MRQNERNVSPMSNEGRNAYVTQHLMDALLELLAENPIQDISISELCERAGVGRASFYRNFESKEDVLRTCTSQLFQAWADGAIEDGDRPLSEKLGALFAHFESHRNFYELLSKRGFIYLIKDVLLALYGPKPEQTAFEAYTRAYFVYSLYGWIEVWFQRGMRESAEEIVALFQGQGL